MSGLPTIFVPVSKTVSCISKSKFIAEDVSLSSKEIGALIVKLQDSVDDLNRTLVVHGCDHLAC